MLETARVAILQSSSPRLFQVIPTEALIFMKPPEVYRPAYVYS